MAETLVAITDGVDADPDTARIFRELGSNIDPQTNRAYFDIGNRADNSLAVFNGANTANGTVGQPLGSNHPDFSDFMKARGAAAVKNAYNDALSNGLSVEEARRAAGRVATGWSNGTKALLLGALDTSALSGGVALSGSTGSSVFVPGNYDALESLIKNSDFYYAGAQHGLVFDVTTKGIAGRAGRVRAVALGFGRLLWRSRASGKTRPLPASAYETFRLCAAHDRLHPLRLLSLPHVIFSGGGVTVDGQNPNCNGLPAWQRPCAQLASGRHSNFRRRQCSS